MTKPYIQPYIGIRGLSAALLLLAVLGFGYSTPFLAFAAKGHDSHHDSNSQIADAATSSSTAATSTSATTTSSGSGDNTVATTTKPVATSTQPAPTSSSSTPAARTTDKQNRNDDNRNRQQPVQNDTLANRIRNFFTRNNQPATSTPKVTATTTVTMAVASSTATSTSATSSVYAVIKATPAEPPVIRPYSAEAVVNTFFPSENYPDGHLGTVASASLTLVSIASGLAGVLMATGKILLL